MGPQVLLDRVARVLEVAERPRAGGARLAARGGEPLRDPVVAEAALVHGGRARVDEPAPVRASLNAIAAAEAIGLVHEHDAVRALERRAHRADLHAGRMRALVAELGHEEVLRAVAHPVLLGEAVEAAVRRVHLGVVLRLERPEVLRRDVVPLDPRPEEEGLLGDVVLGLARADAVSAPDALLDVDHHRPPVVGVLVGVRFLGPGGQHVIEGRRRRGGQDEQLPGPLQELPPIDRHLDPS